MSRIRGKDKDSAKSTIATIEKDIEYKDLSFMYEYDLDREGRTLFFHGDVDEDMVDRLIKGFVYLDSQGEGKFPIKLYVCSYGGSVDHMFSLYDVIQQCRSKVITIGTGAICSAAVLILACGDERYVTENAWSMVHKAKSGSYGDTDEVASYASAFKMYEDNRYRLLAKHSNLTAKQWREKENKKGEVWMKPKDMRNAGIIDHVLLPNRKSKK